MSISPPSDIVLDVARAADPARYTQAAAKLTRTAPSSSDFAEFLKTSTATDATAAADPAPGPTVAATKSTGDAKQTYQAFEAMTLASLIEDAMPTDAVSYYGSGVAGGIWKSMLAEQIGKQMAKAGGIGLATQLAKSATSALTGESANAAAAASGDAARSMLVAKAERGFLATLSTPGDDNGSKK